MEQQQHHKEYQWQVEEEADLQPRQSRRHRLNNHAAIISPSTCTSGTCSNSSITDVGSSSQSIPPNRAGYATPSLTEQEEDTDQEDADNNRITEEFDNEYDLTAASEAFTEFHGARENDVCFDNGQGTDPTHEFSGIRNAGHEYSVLGKKIGDEVLYTTVEDSDIPKGPGTEVNSHYGENFEDLTFSGLCQIPVEKSSEIQSTSVKLINNEVTDEVGVDLTEEIDGRVIDLDVEAVLEKQQTHDLYCPNCNSCITRRIILRAANQGDDTDKISSGGSPMSPDDGYTADRDVDIFRCLSCFTCFIPPDKENMQNPRKISTSSTCWLFSLFPSNKEKLPTEQEDNNSKSQQGGLESRVPSSSHGTSSHDQSSCSLGLADGVVTKPREVGKDIVDSSIPEDIEEKLDDSRKKSITGESMILIVKEEPVEPEASEMAQEILKSIVYGGLIESITSLGVVLSAAGAGAVPLIVFALGLANLIGGLFIIGNNLLELRNDSSGRASNQIDLQEDRYQELLGRSANFKLHATVAFLSYLIFGSVSPVVYGVLYREIDNGEFKLAAVVATSLICIILLAIGKAHTRQPPKSYIRTVMYYITMALMASGPSYITGHLLKELLDKFGWFESDLVITMPFSEKRLTEPAWASH